MHRHILQSKYVTAITKTESFQLLKIWPVVPWAVRGKKAESNVKRTEALSYQRLPVLRVRTPKL